MLPQPYFLHLHSTLVSSTGDAAKFAQNALLFGTMASTPQLGPWGGTAANPPLRVLLPQLPQPVHQMGTVPIPNRRSAYHRLPCHSKNQEQKTPTPTALLSPVQRQRPLCHSQRLGPLGLYANVQPNADICIFGWQHQLHQGGFF